jgi:amino acid adenylation domain-containing protein
MTDHAAAADIEDIYELSPMQVGMLFQSLLAPEAGVFIEQLATRIRDGVDAAAFERAWQSVVDRTPVLRTSFHWEDLGKPIQVVHRDVLVPIHQFDWRGTVESEQSFRLAEYLRALRADGIDLGSVPLMRIALIRVSDRDAWFVWTFHHLLLDGWSTQLVLREVVDQYGALRRGEPYHAPTRRPFSDFIGWLQEQDAAAAEAFWRKELEGFSAPTAVPGEGVFDGRAMPDEGEHRLTLSSPATNALRAFGRRHRLTLNTIVQGAWALLLSRYSGEPDVLYGTVVSGRPTDLPGIESMVGLFINTLPIRVRVPGDAVLLDWLEGIQRRQVEAEQHQCVSTLDFQNWSGLPRGIKLFDTVLIFENFPATFRTEARTISDGEDSIDLGRTDVALAVMVMPGEKLRVKLVYDQRRFGPAFVARLAGHFASILQQIPISPDGPLRALSVLGPEERRRVLVEWNDTAAAGYADEALMAQLAGQAQRAPDAPAFYADGRQVSLREIHESSSRFANLLIGHGVEPGAMVGVWLDRSLEAVVAFLGILKARAVYLPLDRAYPRERVAFMLEDSGCRLVVTNGDAPLPPLIHVIDLSAAGDGLARCSSICPPHASLDDVAYVLYTSGSTGRPKGVAVEHRVVLNRLDWMWRAYPFEPGEVGVMRTPLNFVDTFWEILGGLLRGVPSVIAPEGVGRDPEAFIDLLALHGVTRLFLVPSHLEMLLAAAPDLGQRLPRLRQWWSGGEPLSVDLCRRFRAAAPSAVLYNVYGASELWDATVFDTTAEEGMSGRVPIGRPIANTEAYILDADGQPVPVGVVGRLHFGGACLARGYLNQDALTAERFRPHPFDRRRGARVYDTGDMARFRPDGVIEFMGRRDAQINLNGFRIEPGEVEAAIESHPSVSESIVTARDSPSGSRLLVAYAVSAGGPGDTAALLAHIRLTLPPYAVPATIIWLDALPKTPSGKRDRTRVPQGPLTGVGRQPWAAPQTVLERRLAAWFEEVLGISGVGRDDHFFADLGGHSLLATRLVSRLRAELGCDLPLRTIFQAPTVASLAAEVAPAMRSAASVAGDIASEIEALTPAEAQSLLASLRTETDREAR